MTTRRLSPLLAALAAAGLAPWAAPATGQVVSPGRLAAPHAELEGLRRCTECHELGRAGIAPDRCLACHEPLARRIADGSGFHGRLEERDCAACHAEHLGRDADLVRLDTTSFRHDAETGHELRGAHAAVACGACHRPSLIRAADVRSRDEDGGFLGRTYLGLATACVACHGADSPHGARYEARSCDGCHDEEGWEGAPRFDHAEARFRLTGAHREVPCGECHPPAGSGADGLRLSPIAHGSCADCHGDPHGGAMAGGCRACHTTEAWHQVARDALQGRFDHDRTGFALTGRHGALDCAACHRPGNAEGVRIRFVRGTEGHTYPRPIAASCGACHLDAHGRELAGDCRVCHRDTGWLPTTFGPDRHAATAFPLEGAHAAVPCGECHPPAAAPRFRIATSCESCHDAEDPHAGMFGDRGCAQCHAPTRFADAEFEHAMAGGAACGSCHAGDDPHGGQFAEGCDACHDVTTFRIADFDHARTGFPLEGAHAAVACTACHREDAAPDGTVVVRYRALASACRDCHGGGS